MLNETDLAFEIRNIIGRIIYTPKIKDHGRERFRLEKNKQ